MRFLFDEHVHRTACRELQRGGVDVIHTRDIGLEEADDPVVLDYAITEDRILVTRNHRDFAPLVDQYVRAGRRLPGVLFLPSSIAGGDAGGHVRALERWIDSRPPGVNPVANTYGWL